jgi:Tetracyclin repressor-like, C-terminal domain
MSSLKGSSNAGARRARFARTSTPSTFTLVISALCFFRVANRHTFGEIFRIDLYEPHRRQKHRRMISDTVLELIRRK